MNRKNVMVNETIYEKGCNGFTRVSNEITLNDKLTIIEIGLMTKLLSNQDTYVINKTVEQKKSGISTNSFNNAWKTLETEGYISSNKLQTKGGYKYIYTIRNTPISKSIKSLEHKPLENSTNTPPSDSHTLGIQNLAPMSGLLTHGESMPGGASVNIDKINKEKKNKNIKNTEVTKLEVNNKGKLTETFDRIINDYKLYIENTVTDTLINSIHPEGISNENSLIKITPDASEGNSNIKLSNTINPDASVGINSKIINKSKIPDASVGNCNDDITNVNTPAVSLLNNNTRTTSDNSGPSIVNSNLFEPADGKVQIDNTKKIFSTIQEEVKHMIKVYVKTNNILPEAVKDSLTEIYTYNLFTKNECDAKELFRKIIHVSSLHKYIGTNSPTSIQNIILEKVNKYIIENNLDPIHAQQRIKDYLEYNNETFYQTKQNANIDKYFNEFIRFSKLGSTKKLSLE